MDTIDYLAGDNYLTINRSLMMAIGLTESVLAAELASEARYYRKVGKLSDGWFYSTYENLEERVPFSVPTIRGGLARLEEMGLIESKLAGMPAKKYYRFCSYSQFEKILNHVSKDFIQHVSKDFSTKNNKEEKKNDDYSIGLSLVEKNENQQTRMKPSALRQELARVFKANDPSKTQSNQAVAKLQSRIDDDSLIIKAARKMKDQEPIEIKGKIWRPDYFWFVNPEKTDIVSKRIIEAVKSELTEEDIPDGLREQYDVAIRLGEATDYADCKENWGMILPKIIATPEYKELTNGR